MDETNPTATPGDRRPCSAFVAASLIIAAAGTAQACDGKSYSLDATVGQVASGGGLQVRVDKLKLFDDDPDKYTISVKDDADLLADHVVLKQFNTLAFKTRCGIVTVGANRKSMMQGHTLTINWSYF